MLQLDKAKVSKINSLTSQEPMFILHIPLHNEEASRRKGNSKHAWVQNATSTRAPCSQCLGSLFRDQAAHTFDTRTTNLSLLGDQRRLSAGSLRHRFNRLHRRSLFCGKRINERGLGVRSIGERGVTT